MRKRLVCSVCGGLCDSGDMERGKCFECRSIPEQEELQVRRGSEARKIMASPFYKAKKKAELRRSEQRVPMFDLRAAERGV